MAGPPLHLLMSVSMSRQIHRRHERLTAHLAPTRSLYDVSATVDRQASLCSESSAALYARVWIYRRRTRHFDLRPLICVHTLTVHRQVTSLVESATAHSTPIGPLTRMETSMDRERAVVNERSSADVAHKWPLIRVRTDVPR